MRRRDFLQAASLSGATALVGAAAWGRMAYARQQLAADLIGRAKPVLAQKALTEAQDLPSQAREKVLTWFHAPCLNAAEFADRICSERFVERLAACSSQEDKHLELVRAFVNLIGSEDDIFHRVYEIAEELGAQLDSNWTNCCNDISKAWNAPIQNVAHEPFTEDLQSRVEPIIKSQLEGALAQARLGPQRPALSTAISKVGASAILLLRTPNQITIPVFLIAAVVSSYPYIADRLSNRPENYRKDITNRVAHLAQRVGNEFANETRRRIRELHKWQELSLLETANAYATEQVQFFA